jgi:GT2 family glycosyltransferase
MKRKGDHKNGRGDFMQLEHPLVYIIVLNWNGWRDTLQCLASLRDLTYPNFKTIVVDNASTDESVHKIQTAFPDITLIESGGNLGYAGGNNVGFQYGMKYGADYFWVLNNDTFVAPTALEELVSVAESDPKIGVVASKIYYASPPTKLWFAGGKINWKKGLAYHLGVDEEDTGKYDTLIDMDYAVGASKLISREMILRTGGFDDSYFLYFEETDLCCRARKAGFRIVFAPRSLIWHRVANSTVGGSAIVLYYYSRNNIRFMRRHAKFGQFLMAIPYILKRSWYIQSGREANAGNFHTTPRRIRVMLRAWVDGFLNRGGRRDNLRAR